jgi:O-acetyl-ADP-ribose deacetylase (regulator of RNase III)
MSDTRTQITVLGGDITRVPADGLVTAINSGGMWFGGVDGAIQRVAGNMFHSQAARASLVDGNVIYAGTTGPHGGAFNNVIFVVDDLQRPLRDLVTLALQEAENRHLTHVTLPAMRTGVMAGVVEKTPALAIEAMVEAIKTFVESNPTYVAQITVVIYGDSSLEEHMRRCL